MLVSALRCLALCSGQPSALLVGRGPTRRAARGFPSSCSLALKQPQLAPGAITHDWLRFGLRIRLSLGRRIGRRLCDHLLPPRRRDRCRSETGSPLSAQGSAGGGGVTTSPPGEAGASPRAGAEGM